MGVIEGLQRGASFLQGLVGGGKAPAPAPDGPLETRFGESSLDEFVALVDARGGVPFLDAAPQWKTNWYKPTFAVDVTLDPFSEAYCDQQIRLYKEISGRGLDQKINEH